MSDLNNLKKHFENLEVPENATLNELKASYYHLKNLYSSNSIIFQSFDQNDKKKEAVLSEIEESYKILKNYFEEEEKKKSIKTSKRVSEKKIPEFGTYTGNALKIIREVLEIELEEVAFVTGIPLNHLKNIEIDNYKELPPKAYIKAFIRKYAEYLSLDPRKISNNYIENMENVLSKKLN